MKKNKPEIRFKGFEEEWEDMEATHIFRTNDDRNHPNLPVLSASQEFGMIIREDLGFKVQHNKDNEVGYKRVVPGQFVIHLRSFQGGFAHSSIEGITSPAYTIIEFLNMEKQDDIYWKYVLTSKDFIKRLETVTYGIRDGRSISFEDFSELGFQVPPVEEQRKIGTLLTTLDKLIRKLELKLEKLRNIKQALLNQMFTNVNRGGYTVPSIRFKNYNDNWQMKPLRLIANKHSVSNHNIHNQNLLSLSYGKIKRKDISSDKGLLPASFDTYQIVKDGVIVMRFTDLQNDQKSLRVGLAKEEGIISPAYVCISMKDTTKSAFLYQELHYYDAVLKQFYKMGDGMRQTLSYTDIEAMPLAIPNPREQQDIVDFYDELDSYITKCETKLFKTRTMKQSLLQKMFA
jgi:restriction modification system DNA specificity domain protein